MAAELVSCEEVLRPGGERPVGADRGGGPSGPWGTAGQGQALPVSRGHPGGGDSPARRFYAPAAQSTGRGAFSLGGPRRKSSGSSGLRPGRLRPKAARCWNVPAGKPSGRRRFWRPAKVLAPRRRKHCFAARTTRRRPFGPWERNWHLYGAPWGHSLHCLPSCGTSCGPLRQTRPARTAAPGHGPANPGAGKGDCPAGGQGGNPGGCPAGTVCPAGAEHRSKAGPGAGPGGE